MDGSCSLNFVLELDIFMPPPLNSVVKLNSYFCRRLQGPKLAGSWDARRCKFVKAVRYTTFPGHVRPDGIPGLIYLEIIRTHGNRGRLLMQGVKVKTGGFSKDHGIRKRVNRVTWEDLV